jgi:hypothetical protein
VLRHGGIAPIIPKIENSAQSIDLITAREVAQG